MTCLNISRKKSDVFMIRPSNLNSNSNSNLNSENLPKTHVGARLDVIYYEQVHMRAHAL